MMGIAFTSPGGGGELQTATGQQEFNSENTTWELTGLLFTPIMVAGWARSIYGAYPQHRRFGVIFDGDALYGRGVLAIENIAGDMTEYIFTGYSYQGGCHIVISDGYLLSDGFTFAWKAVGL